MEIVYGFFSGNHLKPEDVAALEIEDPYTKELVEAWCRVNFRGNTISFSSMPIWYNSSIRINGKPCFLQKLVRGRCN